MLFRRVTMGRVQRRVAAGLAVSAVGVGGVMLMDGTAGAASSGPSVTGVNAGTVDLSWSRQSFELPNNWFGLGFDDPEAPVKDPAQLGALENLLGTLTINDDGLPIVRIGGATSNTAGIYQEANGAYGICSGHTSGFTKSGQDAPILVANSGPAEALGVDLANGIVGLAGSGRARILLDANYPSPYNGFYKDKLQCQPDDGSKEEPLGQNGAGHLSDGFAAMINAATLNNPAVGALQQGHALYSWELGNEPDLHTVRNTSQSLSKNFYTGVSATDAANALKKFTQQNVSAATRIAPFGTAVAGPALSCPSTHYTKKPDPVCPAGGGLTWLKTFQHKDAADNGGEMLWTGHTYGPSKEKPETPQGMLEEDRVDKTVAKISAPATYLRSPTKGDLGSNASYRVDEFNVQTTGGQKNIADSFASSLWMTDALFTMLNQPGANHALSLPGEEGDAVSAKIPYGVPVGVNVHVRDDTDVGPDSSAYGDQGLANEAFVLPGAYQQYDGNVIMTPANDGVITPRPLLYGMLMFTCAMDAQSSICNPGGAVPGGVGHFVPLNMDNAYSRKSNPTGRASKDALKMWAVKVGTASGPHQLRLVFINKGSKPATPTINTDGASTVYDSVLTDGTTSNVGDPTTVGAGTVSFRGGGAQVQVGGDGKLTAGSLPFDSQPANGGKVTVGIPPYSEALVIVQY